ncbi:MAG TPA: YdeI/OmpD-associated family protein [Nitrososphaerales archaeon]|nr:YdeI/OmpD-associated family protein [Nitrososphaerales archaeon]
MTSFRENLDVPSASDWRSWLKRNHSSAKGVWLVFHRKDSGLSSISYDDALDEALTFGWIDSIIKKIDDRSYARKFTPRQPWSVWSRSNIARVERLKKEGRMTEWGLQAFAKRTGEMSFLEKFDQKDITIPKDLNDALRRNRKAWANFERFAPSHRKRYLIWISGAKKATTRRKRIDDAVILISQNVKNLLK